MKCSLMSLMNMISSTKEYNQEHKQDLFVNSNYLSERKHDFRKRKSCTTNVLNSCERVSSIIDEKDEWVDCVFVDCQKALNTVPRRRWMVKLNFQAGIKGGYSDLLIVV